MSNCSWRKPRNRALADIVATRDATLRLASFEALAGLFLLVRRQDRLAAEFDAVGFGVGPATRGELQNTAALQLRRHAKYGEDDLGKVGCGVGSASERIPAPVRCMSRAITRRSVVSRERRSTAGVMTTSPGARAFISFPSCGRSAAVPIIFSRNIFSHPAALSWRTCPVSSWAAVETRA
jgi:hypothetical protein